MDKESYNKISILGNDEDIIIEEYTDKLRISTSSVEGGATACISNINDIINIRDFLNRYIENHTNKEN